MPWLLAGMAWSKRTSGPASHQRDGQPRPRPAMPVRADDGPARRTLTEQRRYPITQPAV